ncbi:MAG: hypothetical protein JSV35_03725 [Candidatus Bathyarchaeota archaeon]|nr:MAG: hypothetical protein JSV35_03725 [Candidatus Bathyarchaeota archaeon]
MPDLKGIGAQKEYQEKATVYWQQVNEHLSSLTKLGEPTHIFHESVTETGEPAMKAIEQMNEGSHNLIKATLGNGAKLEVAEEPQLLNEYIDWSMCLQVIGRSQDVVKKIIGFQMDASKKRLKHFAKRINETLKKEESGLLIMSDESRISLQSYLPSDIRFFLVHPPAFNDIQRLLRELLTPSRDTTHE